MKRGDTEALIIGAAVLGAVALAWKFYTDAKGAAAAVLSLPGQAGNWVGSTLFDWFNSDGVGDSIYYTVSFKDGTRHAIPSTTVDADGTFTYGGVTYKIKTDANGVRYAIQ